MKVRFCGKSYFDSDDQEAAFILQEGIASAEDIDTAMKWVQNHPMGWLALGVSGRS